VHLLVPQSLVGHIVVDPLRWSTLNIASVLLFFIYGWERRLRGENLEIHLLTLECNTSSSTGFLNSIECCLTTLDDDAELLTDFNDCFKNQPYLLEGTLYVTYFEAGIL
jgi:hypothetical protein